MCRRRSNRTSTHTQRGVVERHHGRLRTLLFFPAERRLAARRSGADGGRPIHRNHSRRGAFTQGDADVPLREHPAAVAGDLRRHRHAGVLRAALPAAGAADGIHLPRTPVTFRADPERNPARIIAESGRGDEIGTAKWNSPPCSAELAPCCTRRAGWRRSVSAVSKINHDLRNAGIGTTDPLIICRPAGPGRCSAAPKLMRTLERAITFCQSHALLWRRASSPPPERKTLEVGP